MPIIVLGMLISCLSVVAIILFVCRYTDDEPKYFLFSFIALLLMGLCILWLYQAWDQPIVELGTYFVCQGEDKQNNMTYQFIIVPFDGSPLVINMNEKLKGQVPKDTLIRAYIIQHAYRGIDWNKEGKTPTERIRVEVLAPKVVTSQPVSIEKDK